MALIPEVDKEARQNTGMDHNMTYELWDKPGEKFMKKHDESVFIRLCDEFYKRVFADEDKWFREIFAEANMEDASQNLCEFLVQRFGGSNEYSNRNGIVNLVSFHAKIGISERMLRRWLQLQMSGRVHAIHMDDACDELDSIIDDDVKDGLMKYFRHMGSTFVVGTERMKEFAALKLDEDLPVNSFASTISGSCKKPKDDDDDDDDW